MKVVLASKNAHKLQEISKITEQFGMELVLQSELGVDIDVEETGTTFEENSLIKARAVMEATGLPALADDSGIAVDALNGEPGIYSARYAPTDPERIAKLLKNLEGKEDRSARFVCVIAIAFNGEVIETFEGEIRGKIAFEPKGENGFGYDPVFIPDGETRTVPADTSAGAQSLINPRPAPPASRRFLRRPQSPPADTQRHRLTGGPQNHRNPLPDFPGTGPEFCPPQIPAGPVPEPAMPEVCQTLPAVPVSDPGRCRDIYKYRQTDGAH